MFAKETFVNATRHYQFGDSGLQETFTDDTGKLFRHLQKEHGKCISAVYLDVEGKTRRIGWVFQKLVQYDDARNNKPESFFLQEVWVELHESKPTLVEHFKFLN